jgi:hypothetical protein
MRSFLGVTITRKKKDRPDGERLDSWTVFWEYKTGWTDETKRRHKTFADELGARTHKAKIEAAAAFIGCWVNVGITPNQ